MKIPVLEAPRLDSRPVGTPDVSLDHRGAAGGELVQGVDQLNAGLQHLQRRRAAAREKALKVDVTDAETRTQERWTSRTVGEGQTPGGIAGQVSTGQAPTDYNPGFYSTNGKTAAERSQQVLEDMEKDLQEEAESLTDPRAREVFLQRGRGLFADQRRRVEAHVAKEREAAEEASVKGRTASAFREVANAPEDDKTEALQLAALEDIVRAGQLSKEDGDAKMTEIRGRSAAMRIDALLAPERMDVDGAARVFERSKEHLDPKTRGSYEKTIGGVRNNIEAERLAVQAVGMAADEKGQVDPDYALAQVDSLVKPGPLRDEARQRVKERAVQAAAKWQADTRDLARQAKSAFNTGGWSAIPQPLRDALNERDPDTYAQLQARSEARVRRARAGSTRETAEQAQALLELQEDIARNPERYRDMSADEFAHEWEDRLSPRGFKVGGGAYVHALKDDPTKAGEFGKFIDDKVKEVDFLRENKPASARYSAAMGEQRRAYLAEKKGEPPAEVRKQMHLNALQSAFGTIDLPGGMQAKPGARSKPGPAKPAGQKVRHKKSGKTGTLAPGAPVPEGFEVIGG